MLHGNTIMTHASLSGTGVKRPAMLSTGQHPSSATFSVPLSTSCYNAPKSKPQKEHWRGQASQQIPPVRSHDPGATAGSLLLSLHRSPLRSISLLGPFMAFPVSLTMSNTQTGVCVKSKGSIYFGKCTRVTHKKGIHSNSTIYLGIFVLSV